MKRVCNGINPSTGSEIIEVNFELHIQKLNHKTILLIQLALL